MVSNRILAHRGHWHGEGLQSNLPKNSFASFQRASENGFGLETDIRDSENRIVISHDPPLNRQNTFDQLLELSFSGLVALNVKSDGLVPLISLYDQIYTWGEHVFFDMSFPEYRKYRIADLPLATRNSEFETYSDEYADFIWLDSFDSDWFIEENTISYYRTRGKKIIIVSPELHGRNHLPVWNELKETFSNDQGLFLCTDFPLQALNFLSGETTN